MLSKAKILSKTNKPKEKSEKGLTRVDKSDKIIKLPQEKAATKQLKNRIDKGFGDKEE